MRRSLAAVALSAAVLSTGCSRLLYQPSHRLEGLPVEEPDNIQVMTSDDHKLWGWWFPARTAKRKGTFVQFHGNAGNITSHFASLAWVTRAGYDFVTFDYRGYGRSLGRPSQAGLNRDAVAIIDWAHRVVPPAEDGRDLVLYGHSLGGAVLLRALDDVRDKRRVRAVVIEGSFHSYQDAAAGILWSHPLLLPLTGFGYALISDAYSPAASIARVSPIPLLVIHDQRDPIIPAGFGDAIFELALEPKAMIRPDRGTHVSATRDPEVRAALLSYVEDDPGVRAFAARK